MKIRLSEFWVNSETAGRIRAAQEASGLTWSAFVATSLESAISGQNAQLPAKPARKTRRILKALETALKAAAHVQRIDSGAVALAQHLATQLDQGGPSAALAREFRESLGVLKLTPESRGAVLRAVTSSHGQRVLEELRNSRPQAQANGNAGAVVEMWRD